MRLHLTGLSVCIILFFCLVASVIHAQSDDVLETREVVVSSTRLPDVPVDARTLPAKVTVITAEDIRKSGAKTVQEAIQWATGIVMYDSIGNAFQQTVDLRGFNGQPVPNTTVFVDGQRMNEPDFNTMNFDLIPYETIDRIEIIPGAAAIYGKNAMGGVINIFTKRGGDKHQVTGETLFGSFQRERYSINASGPIGKLDYYTNFSRETESGFRDESTGRISRFFGKVGYRPTETTDLTISYTYVMSHLQQAGSLPLSVAAFDRKRNFTPGDYEDLETNVVRLTGRQSLPFGFFLNVNGFYRQLAKDFLTVGQTSVSRNPGNTESRGGTVQLSQESVPFGFRNTLVIGSEFTRNDFGNNLVADFSGFTFSSNRATDEDIVGLYVQDTLHLTSQVILTGGVRYDHDQLKFQDFNDTTNNGSLRFNRLTPRAGLTYLLTQATSLYFNYSQGFRVPTIDELFAQGGGFQTNFGLRAAKSDNYEIGTKNRLGGWGEVSLAVFQSNVHDEIFFTCSLCDFSFGDGLNRNIEKSRRRGIEATLKGRLNQYFDGTINYTYTQAEFRSQFNLSSTRTIQDGDSFSQVPKHRLSVTGNVHPAEGWTVSLIGLYVSSQFFQNDEENVQPRLPGYFLLNSRIAYERPVPGGRLSAFLMANNLLDQKYSTSGIIATNATTFQQERFIVPAAGIAIYGGLSYRFEGL
ncbi:MAG: TonB-dependent receptor [Nitrospirota bacterium]|nr:TonB-dependent receptor [Nitrospirota bacterium]